MMKVFQHPFPHIVFDDFLQDHIFKSILKNYPAKKDIEATGNLSSSNRYNFMRGTEQQLSLVEKECWAYFKHYMENSFIDEMIQTFSKFDSFNTASFVRSDLVCEFDISRASKGYTRSCHLDRRHHLLSFLFYLNDKKDFGGHGGDLVLYSVEQEVQGVNDIFPDPNLTTIEKIIEPKPNRLVGFINTNDSYHGITSMEDNTGDRLFVYISIDAKDKNSIWPKEDLMVLSEDRRTRFLNE